MSTTGPRNRKDELRAMTNSERYRDNSVMMSSVMPSLKYCCSGSSLILLNGSTAMDGFMAVGDSSSGIAVVRPSPAMR